jgi:hypothetical protein
MPLWNHRRLRPRHVERAAEAETSWTAYLRSRHGLRQLAVLAALVAGMLLMVQAPHPPLPYQKGVPVTHPILARVDFDYVDREVTREVRELVSLVRVPDQYDPDPRQVTALKESMSQLVAEIAKAESLQQVPEALCTAWKLTAGMFDLVKKAIGPGASNLAAVQEAAAKAMTALADPRNLPIVSEEDYRRTTSRLERIRDLRSRLPASLPPETVPDLEEPITLTALVTDGQASIPLRSVIAVTQTDSIQARIEPFIEPALGPIFGAKGLTALAAAMAPRIGPTLIYDAPKTGNARVDVTKGVAQVRILRKANTTLVEAGKEITDADLKILEQEQEARLAQMGWFRTTLAWLGAAVMLVVLVLLLAAYTARFQPSAARSFPRTLMLALLCFMVVGASKAVAQARGQPELYTLLLAVAGMVVAVAYTETFALVFTATTIVLVAMATQANLDWVVTAAVGTSVAVLLLGDINNRSKLVKVGALAGLAFFLAQSSLAFWRPDYGGGEWGSILKVILWPSLLYFCVGLAAGIVMLAILPFIERVFGIVTNISLLELCNVNQPALKRLALEAPGSYTHSLLIGTLAEAAAEAIGANGLLARVGAYFHDIGKATKPHYFIENVQDLPGPHAALTPDKSRTIIMAHVKDGLEMAERLSLPHVIRQFIAEHHGTMLMEYFYRDAQRRAQESGTERPTEADYRYPGPKPHSLETAIVMLADAAEGATRSLTDHSAEKVEATVHEMVMRRLLDGQLDRSGLTLSELHKVEETLTKTLLSVYHGRLSYPPEAEAGGTAAAAGAGALSGAEGGTSPAAGRDQAGHEPPPAAPDR